MSTKEQYQKEIIKYLKKYEKTKNIPGKDAIGLNCSAANTSCWITWNGTMISCALLPEPYTNPDQHGFIKAWEELKSKCDQLVLSSTCSHCPKRQICTICPASAYTETGHIDGTSKYHCQMTNEILKEMYQYINNNNIDINDYDENGDYL